MLYEKINSKNRSVTVRKCVNNYVHNTFLHIRTWIKKKLLLKLRDFILIFITFYVKHSYTNVVFIQLNTKYPFQISYISKGPDREER